MSARRLPRSVVAFLLLATITLIAAACSPGASTVSPTPQLTIAPTGTPSVAGTGAGPKEPCATTPGTGCLLFGGDYRSTRFGGGVSLHLVGDEWTNTANEADVLVLFAGGGAFGGTPDESLVLVHGAPKLRAAAASVTDPDQAKAILVAIAGLAVTPVAGPVIDGQAGTVFRVANTGSASITLWRYPTTTGAGSYDLPAGSSAEVHWLAVGGVPTIVAILAPTNKLDATLSDLDPTLASIHFG